MLPCPDGWIERRSGDSSLLVPRHGAVAIRVDQRLVPLRNFSAAIAFALSRTPHFAAGETTPNERFLTDEGEIAVITTIVGRERGSLVTRVVAAVYADDFYNLFDGRVPDGDAGEMKTMIRDLAKRHRLHLGARQRRFFFRPIDGWHRVTGLYLDVAMFPAEYPKRVSVIQVWAAVPIHLESGALAIDALDRADRLAGLTLEPGQHLAANPMRTRTLAGHEWRRRLAGPGGLRFVRQFVELRDARYVYRLRLDGNEHDELDRHRELFRAVVSSVEAIPAPTTPAPISTLSEIWSID